MTPAVAIDIAIGVTPAVDVTPTVDVTPEPLVIAPTIVLGGAAMVVIGASASTAVNADGWAQCSPPAPTTHQGGSSAVVDAAREGERGKRASREGRAWGGEDGIVNG